MSAITLRALLIVSGLFLGTALAEAHAHQCIDVDILSSPARVRAGSNARMVAGVVNCGSCETPVHLDAWLVDPDNMSRIHLGGERLRLREGEGRRVRLRLAIPNGVPSGRYMLVLTGETSGGYMDLARAPIAVVPGPTLDIPRLLARLDANPDDDEAMDALFVVAESMLEPASGELEAAEPVPAQGSITGEIVHKRGNKIRVVNRLGRTKTVKVDRATVIRDENGNPLRFNQLHEGDRVEVDYDSSGTATLITKL
ncbi:MAG: hypothetical protein CMJ65_02305 [Planctomycetaceae bacterium]|nr:hypothetical protein [Planctomycetaceae bacterium]